jgi:hypothetical protein
LKILKETINEWTNNTMVKWKRKRRWQTIANKALHRKRKNGHRYHNLKPGVKWKEPVPAPLV